MFSSRFSGALALAGLTLTLTGCGGNDGPAAHQTDWPHGSGELVLRMQTFPGMVPPNGSGPRPDFSVYGDGRVVVSSAEGSPPAVAHLDEGTVAELLDQAVALVDGGEATGVAWPDAPVVELTFIRDGADDQATLDGTDADVSKLRQQVLDSVPGAIE